MREPEVTRTRGPKAGPDSPTQPRATTEDIHVRNYDVKWGYDVVVEITDGDGECVFEERYYLLPGQAKSEFGIVDPGDYDITVELDNHRTEATRCSIGTAPEHTALIEVGNGTVTLNEGLW